MNETNEIKVPPGSEVPDGVKHLELMDVYRFKTEAEISAEKNKEEDSKEKKEEKEN